MSPTWRHRAAADRHGCLGGCLQKVAHRQNRHSYTVADYLHSYPRARTVDTAPAMLRRLLDERFAPERGLPTLCKTSGLTRQGREVMEHHRDDPVRALLRCGYNWFARSARTRLQRAEQAVADPAHPHGSSHDADVRAHCESDRMTDPILAAEVLAALTDPDEPPRSGPDDEPSEDATTSH